MAHVDDIKMAALSLPQGSTMRIDCPVCGATGKTMTVTRINQNLKYKCHRASCKAAGSTGSRYDGTTTTKPKGAPDVESSPVPEDLREWLLDRFSLEPETLDTEGVLYWEKHQRVLLPIRDFSGRRYGYVARAYNSGYVGAKSLNVIQDTDWPGGAFTRTSKDSSVAIIVEDLWSAYAAAEFGYAGIALVGTHCTDELEEQLIKYDEIVVALDADATDKAAALVRKLGYLKVSQLVLEMDIKDMDVMQRSELLRRTDE